MAFIDSGRNVSACMHIAGHMCKLKLDDYACMMFSVNQDGFFSVQKSRSHARPCTSMNVLYYSSSVSH